MNLASNCAYHSARKLNVKLLITAKFYYALKPYFSYLSCSLRLRINMNKFYCISELKLQ